MFELSAKYIARAEECSFAIFLLKCVSKFVVDVMLINCVKTQKPSASLKSLNGEERKAKHLFGGFSPPLFYFSRRCLMKLFKGEFLQHLLCLFFLCFGKAGERMD